MTTYLANHLEGAIAPTVTVPKYLHEINLLLACAQTDCDRPTVTRIEALLQNQLDWDYLIATARNHGVVPLLYQSLRQICPQRVPLAILEQLRQQFLENACQNLRLTRKLFQVLALLEAQNIPVIPYKGPALAARLYGNLALRTFCDLDLIVPKHQVLAVRTLLLANGYQRVYSLTLAQEIAILNSEQEMTFRHQETAEVIDLHWEITAPHSPQFVPMTGFWEQLERASFQGKTILQFAPEDLLLLLCQHGLKDQWRALKWVCDLNELLRVYPQFNWLYLWQRAEAFGASRLVLIGLGLSQSFLGTPLPAAVARRIVQDQVIQSAVQSLQEQLFSPDNSQLVERWILSTSNLGATFPEKLRYLLPKFLLPNERDFALLSLPRSLFFLYYLLRPIRILLTYPLNPWRMLKLLGRLFR